MIDDRHKRNEFFGKDRNSPIRIREFDFLTHDAENSFDRCADQLP